MAKKDEAVTSGLLFPSLCDPVPAAQTKEAK
jgi:hypothetical protein